MERERHRQTEREREGKKEGLRQSQRQRQTEGKQEEEKAAHYLCVASWKEQPVCRVIPISSLAVSGGITALWCTLPLIPVSDRNTQSDSGKVNGKGAGRPSDRLTD